MIFKMHFSKLTYNEFISKSQNLIDLSLANREITEATSKFGYGIERIKLGEELFKQVLDTVYKQETAMKKKIDVHQIRKSLQNSTRKQYMKILLIARIAFDKDALVRKALQLDGPREVHLDSWINQVTLFGNRLLSESKWVNQLNMYGISKEEIVSLLVGVEKLSHVVNDCINAKLDAKRFTNLKRSKIKEMQGWVSDYLKIAKIALEANIPLYNQLKMDQK